MSTSIFINYRRDDTSAEALLVANALSREFGEQRVFMDVASMDPGAEWPAEIAGKLKEAATVIALIGPDWLRAGSDEWGRRRIDRESDWVRRELETALNSGKTVIPLLVRDGKVPPAEALPPSIHALGQRQAISIRRDYWNHDIKLLLAKLATDTAKGSTTHKSIGPYPTVTLIGPEKIPDARLKLILEKELPFWKRVLSPLPEDPAMMRAELHREFKFKSFFEAIRFMSQVAAGCDIADHHPRWENIWKTVRVYLTTWDIGHAVSDRDVQLARYFDCAYADFPGAAKPAEPPAR